MKVLVDKRFYDSVPKHLVSKIEGFTQKLSCDANNLFQHGKYCRKIKGTENKYKFRVNSGDRVVFQYEKDAVRLLRFCNHDAQIRVAERVKPVVQELEVQRQEYVEDAYDKKIDQEILEDIQNQLLDDNLDDALNLLKEAGAANSNKAKNIRKIIEVADAREVFFENKEFVSRIEIKCAKLESASESDQYSVIRKKDIMYAMNRLVSESQCSILPFVYITVTGTNYIRDVYLEGIDNKRQLAEKIADYFDSNIKTLNNGKEMVIYALLKDKEDNIIPSQKIIIRPYQKEYERSTDEGILLLVEDTLGKYANNFRIVKGQEKMRKINLDFLGIKK